ncbi:MAG: type III-A CRISPR-associated protein Cas10/Csm1 [Anaerolineae bacterium]|nr:type III-A CRISPR-associated protein Cas10/Csm1 [Anaerolineae bacterium]
MDSTIKHDLETRVWQAALAGLLHDVGKFSQRAGLGKSETWDKDARAQIKYVHALYSYDFMRKAVPEKWRTELSAIAYHHEPRNLQERWVQIADWLSSAERVEGKDEDVDTSDPILQTVFSRVESEGKKADKPSYWHLARLDVGNRKELFPSETRDGNWRNGYAHLWDTFLVQCNHRGITADSSLTPIAFLENLMALLQEFTWCMPSAYWKTVPDVSLFDHLRTTAAIAACIAADEQGAEWCDAVGAKQTRETALFIAGDFSGIQKFIYTLASSGAAKSLRARSFYLQLLSEIVALNVLDALGMPLTNLVYVGGGKFYVLAPLRARNILPKLAQQLSDKLMEAHQGALGLTMAWEAVTSNDFSQFNEVYERLGESLSKKKRQPLGQASSRVLAEQIGVPLSLGGNPEKFCAVTGDDWELETREEEGGAKETKTKFVWSLEKLGSQLANATHLILRRVPNAESKRPTDWREGLRQFGFEVTLTRDELPRADAEGLVRVWRIDSKAPAIDGKLLSSFKAAQLAISDHPIAKLVPRDKNDQILTFDELAAMTPGIKRWGVLRMDVDNLGAIFREGLGKHASISRIASLSFGLRLFFEGWLPHVADANADLTDKLYIQYAGGDDLFVVGVWDALPPFALSVRESFREFTGNNSAFGISGGIVIVESKFPLYQAAQLAEEAEHKAKYWRAQQKDAVTFLDETADWKTFAETMRNANELADWRRANRVPASLLQTIMALRAQIIQAKPGEKDKPLYGRWMWMAAYQLKRAEDAVKRDDPEIKERIQQIQLTFLEPGDASEQWGRAARWAQYLSRGGE